MKTETKIKIAQALSAGVRLGGPLLGLEGSKALVKRDGLNWDLDLTEGIDLQIYLFGKFEPATSKVLKALAKNCHTILDIGANIGSHSLPLAAAAPEAAEVFAIEPTDWAVDRLKKNIALNPSLSAKIEVAKVALGDGFKNSIDGFYSSWSLVSKEEKQHPIHKGYFNQASNTPQLTLDAFCLGQGIQKVDLIKMDVDGFEVKVLEGAKATLKKDRPILVFELSPYVLEENGDSVEELFDVLDECQYEVLDLAKRKPISRDFKKMRQDLAGGGINVFGVPKEAPHLQIP